MTRRDAKETASRTPVSNIRDRGDVRRITKGSDGDTTETGFNIVWGNDPVALPPRDICDQGDVRRITKGSDGDTTETGHNIVWGNDPVALPPRDE